MTVVDTLPKSSEEMKLTGRSQLVHAAVAHNTHTHTHRHRHRHTHTGNCSDRRPWVEP